MNQNRKKIAKDHIKKKRVIAIPNIIASLAFEKLGSYNFCENVTYRAVYLVGHALCFLLCYLQVVFLFLIHGLFAVIHRSVSFNRLTTLSLKSPTVFLMGSGI